MGTRGIIFTEINEIYDFYIQNEDHDLLDQNTTKVIQKT